VIGPTRWRHTRPWKGRETLALTVMGSNVACAASLHIENRSSGATDDVSMMRLSVLPQGAPQYGADAALPTSLATRSPMSSTRKALLAVAAVAVLAVAFGLARPGGGDDASPTASEPAQTGQPATVEDAAAPTATAPAAAPRPAATPIAVRGGQPVGGVATIEVEKGDTLRFTVSSDQSDEVHVHGYDLERPVGPGAPARFSFTADADGIFEVELHGSGAQIASLEVQPR
jgi:hypothetical protein